MQELEDAEAAAAGRGKGAKKDRAGAKKPAGKPTQAPKEQGAGAAGKPAQPVEAKRKDLTVRGPQPSTETTPPLNANSSYELGSAQAAWCGRKTGMQPERRGWQCWRTQALPDLGGSPQGPA